MTPLLLGHRGTPRLHPENSLIGFQAALDAGLDGIETDVRRLGDGELVICHDAQLNDGRKLDTLSRADLPAHVPLLPDVLAWAAQTGAYLNIEIKPELGKGDGRTEETLDLIRAYGLTEQVIVSSFSPLQLLAALQHAPQIERGFLYHRPYQIGCDLVTEVARRVKVAALHPHFSLITPQLMDTARQEGWRVNTWTVNDAAQGRRLTEMGVSGLIGDLPDVLLAMRPESEAQPHEGCKAADHPLLPGRILVVSLSMTNTVPSPAAGALNGAEPEIRRITEQALQKVLNGTPVDAALAEYNANFKWAPRSSQPRQRPELRQTPTVNT